MNKFQFYDNKALIVDFMYYTEHIETIDDWLEENDCQRKGMVIEFCNDQVRTMFMLKWL